MTPTRKYLRIVRNALLVIIVLAAAWLLIQPWVAASPNSQFQYSRFRAQIKGAVYMAELREDVSQRPYHLIRDITISAWPMDDPAHPPELGSLPLWPLRMEAASGPQRVRLIDVLTENVVVDEAEVEWLPVSDRGDYGIPVSWAGNRLLVWPPGPHVTKPSWRQANETTATFGRQYVLNSVYRILAYKVIGMAFAAGLLVFGGVWLIDRQLAGPSQGLCQNCGYNLRGTGADRCPECGAESTTKVALNPSSGSVSTTSNNDEMV